MEYKEQQYFESEIEEAIDQLETDRLLARYKRLIPREETVQAPSKPLKNWKVILAAFAAIAFLLLAFFKVFLSNGVESETQDLIASLSVYENPEWSMRSDASTLGNVFSVYQEYLSNQQFNDALNVASQISDSDKDINLQLSLAQVNLKMENYARSLELCDEIIALQSIGVQEAEFTKALALVALKKNQEAIPLLEKIITNEQHQWKKLKQLNRLIRKT